MRFNAESRRSDPLVWLLGLMLAGYFAQVFSNLLFKSEAVTNFLALTKDGMLHMHVWTPLSYVFAHGSPWHLIINMLIIFMVGKLVQTDLGRRRFIWLSVLSALGGAAVFLLFHLGPGRFALLGASAVAMGYMTVYCMARPDEPVTFLILFVLPVSVKPRKLLVGLVFVEVIMLTAELQGVSDVASSAHLGGILAAFLYFRKSVMGLPLFPSAKGIVRRSRGRVPHKTQNPRYKVNITTRGDMKGEVDRILDKINSQGFGSLSDDEKQLLDRARDILGR
jgi:membrane associated rhomboid family serine protease